MSPVSNFAQKLSFKAKLEKPDDGIDGAYVTIPYDVEEVYGTKGQVKVKALFDGHPYRGVLANMGVGCHVIIVRKDIRAAIGKQVGDAIKVVIEPDTEERVVKIPEALANALSKNKKTKEFFDSLSFTNRKEYVNWINSAKKEETRERRLKLAIEKLKAKKKNPSEK